MVKYALQWNIAAIQLLVITPLKFTYLYQKFNFIAISACFLPTEKGIIIRRMEDPFENSEWLYALLLGFRVRISAKLRNSSWNYRETEFEKCCRFLSVTEVWKYFSFQKFCRSAEIGTYSIVLRSSNCLQFLLWPPITIRVFFSCCSLPRFTFPCPDP